MTTRGPGTHQPSTERTASRSFGTAEPGDRAARERSRIDIERVRRNALDHDEPIYRDKGRPLLPHLQQMAIATKGTDAWEAYEIVYRTASPWIHVGGRALAGDTLERRSDGTHLQPRPLWDPPSIRSIAAPCFSVLLGAVSRIAGLGFESECRLIQDSLAEWPTELAEEHEIMERASAGKQGDQALPSTSPERE